MLNSKDLPVTQFFERAIHSPVNAPSFFLREWKVVPWREGSHPNVVAFPIYVVMFHTRFVQRKRLETAPMMVNKPGECFESVDGTAKPVWYMVDPLFR